MRTQLGDIFRPVPLLKTTGAWLKRLYNFDRNRLTELKPDHDHEHEHPPSPGYGGAGEEDGGIDSAARTPYIIAG